MRKQKEGIIKMKRLAKVILCVCLAAAIMVPTYAQEIFEPAMVLSDEAHVYDVVPGSSEWNELEPEERYEACAVSESEVQGMTTRALVETVLNYPYLINIYAYDSLSLGIEEVSEYFPGVQELLNRSDATEALEEYLASKVDVQNAGEVDLASYDAKTLIGFISMALLNINEFIFICFLLFFTLESVDSINISIVLFCINTIPRTIQVKPTINDKIINNNCAISSSSLTIIVDIP